MAYQSRMEDTIMSIEEAKQVLQEYQSWRKFKGAPWVNSSEDPDCPDRQKVSEAIDVAITMLNSLTSKPEKEYYGG